MTCPCCGGSMHQGRLELGRTSNAIEFFDTGTLYLVFRSDLGELALFDSRSDAFAWYCGGCRCFVANHMEQPRPLEEKEAERERLEAGGYETADSTVIVCPGCGAENPAGAERCVLCRRPIA